MPSIQQKARFDGADLIPDNRRIDRLVFLHLEKAAGKSLKSLLEQVFGPENVSPHTDVGNFVADAAGYLVPVGHIDRKTVGDSLDGYQWFTFLRAPVGRIVSLMNYWTQVAHEASWIWRDASDTGRQAYRLARTATFEEFLNADNEKIREQVHNTACRRITGEAQGARNDAAYAGLAFEMLRDDALFFGLQERYEMSLLQMPVLLDLPPCRIDLRAARQNETVEKRLTLRDVRHVDRAAVGAVAGADILLYRMASNLFQKRVEAIVRHAFHPG